MLHNGAQADLQCGFGAEANNAARFAVAFFNDKAISTTEFANATVPQVDKGLLDGESPNFKQVRVICYFE